jgi:hypothetical protein
MTFQIGKILIDVGLGIKQVVVVVMKGRTFVAEVICMAEQVCMADGHISLSLPRRRFINTVINHHQPSSSLFSPSHRNAINIAHRIATTTTSHRRCVDEPNLYGRSTGPREIS